MPSLRRRRAEPKHYPSFLAGSGQAESSVSCSPWSIRSLSPLPGQQHRDSSLRAQLLLGEDQMDMEGNQDISEKRESYRSMKELLSWQGRKGTWVITLPATGRLHPALGYIFKHFLTACRIKNSLFFILLFKLNEIVLIADSPQKVELEETRQVLQNALYICDCCLCSCQVLPLNQLASLPGLLIRRR